MTPETTFKILVLYTMFTIFIFPVLIAYVIDLRRKVKETEKKYLDNKRNFYYASKYFASIDKMCSHCGGFADVISEVEHIKLCERCYRKYMGYEK